MRTLSGAGASKGIAMGKAFIKREKVRQIERKTIQDVEAETRRFRAAKNEAVSQLEKLQARALEEIGKDEAFIFEAQKMMLQDRDFLGKIEEIIDKEKINAEFALKRVTQEYTSLFAGLDDPYLRERAADIEDISQRLLGSLLGVEEQSLTDLKGPVIIAAQGLFPSDTVQMDRENVLGLITEGGGVTSHLAILARTMRIPAIVGVTGLMSAIEQGDTLIVDGSSGKIIINPEQAVKESWRARQKDEKERVAKLQKLKGTESKTKDGKKIRIAANIGTPEDMVAVLENDAEGVGLFRTEYLYMHSERSPSEEEQFQAYKAVLEKMPTKPVIIRTLDVGGDKEIPYLQIEPEENPFLGYRAIRVSLEKSDLFQTQLRALYRASVFGTLGIMFPMITNLAEVQLAKTMVEEVKTQLTAEGIPFREDVELGIMIETPAAAVISDLLAKEVDFFSIGTNDLTQYTVAVDRMNAKVAHLYDEHHPAVLRLVRMTIENGHKEGIWVGICGEAAADISLTETFIAMGVDELSVNPGAVLEVREKIQNTSYEKAQTKLQHILM